LFTVEADGAAHGCDVFAAVQGERGPVDLDQDVLVHVRPLDHEARPGQAEQAAQENLGGPNRPM
jgi:hypothetical protein